MFAAAIDWSIMSKRCSAAEGARVALSINICGFSRAYLKKVELEKKKMQRAEKCRYLISLEPFPKPEEYEEHQQPEEIQF